MKQDTVEAVVHLGEEIANSITHGLGLAASIAGLVVLVVLAAIRGSAWTIVSCSVYGATLVLLYLASTLYHAIPGRRTKRVFRVLDHCAIFLLIAGTYTPFIFVGMRNRIGWTIFGIVWGLAVAGIVLRTCLGEGHEVMRTALYIAMGWVAIGAIKPLLSYLSRAGFAWLIAGGLAYTLGVIFFALDRKYCHAIWHVFVMAGSACHYVAILVFVVLRPS